MTMSLTNEHDNEEDYLQLPRKVSINSMSIDDYYCVRTTVSSSLLEDGISTSIIDSGTTEDDITRSKLDEEDDDKVHADDEDDDDEAYTIDDDNFLSLLGIHTYSSNDDDTAEERDEDTKKLIKNKPSSTLSSEDDMEIENVLSLLDWMNDTDNSVSVDNMLDNYISNMLENDDDPTSVVSSIIPPRCLVDDFVSNTSDSKMDVSNIAKLSSLPSPTSLMEVKETTTTRATRSNSIEHQEQGALKLRSASTNKRLRVRSSMSSSVKRRFLATTDNNITVPSSVSLEQVDVGMLKVKQLKIIEPQRQYMTRSQRAQVHPLK